MTNVHPTLEAVAWAICESQNDQFEAAYVWEGFLLEARAALNALADSDDGSGFLADELRQFAAEPKSVESVLRNRCLLPERNVELVAKQLRDAGLVNE